MLEFLIKLELKRQALIQSRDNKLLSPQRSYFGIAAFVFFACTLPQIIAPPTALVTAPPEFVVVGALILVSCLCLATIVLAPLGLVFF